MSPTWNDAPPPHTNVSAWGKARMALILPLLAIWVFSGLALHLTVRLIEWPMFRMQRPVTPHITQTVCKGALWLLGIKRIVSGTPAGTGAVVANHSSWLDIFALNAGQRVYFVAKSEVAGWPGIGWLARATGTLFIRRDRREAQRQVLIMQTRLKAGHQLLFFPEGTSSDGRRVLPFKSTLFASFLNDKELADLQIQPVSVVYRAPAEQDPRLFGWWGDMDFGPHLITTIAAGRGGAIEMTYHPPVRVGDFDSRKALASKLEATIASLFKEFEG